MMLDAARVIVDEYEHLAIGFRGAEELANVRQLLRTAQLLLKSMKHPAFRSFQKAVVTVEQLVHDLTAMTLLVTIDWRRARSAPRQKSSTRRKSVRKLVASVNISRIRSTA